MRLFSFRPSLSVRGRKPKGLRGLAGKPLHPPLTDVPVGAYILAAAFDVISFLGDGEPWARELYRAGTFVLAGGLLVAVLAAITGVADWVGSTSKGTQAWRTVNAHAATMAALTVLVVVELVLRAGTYGAAAATPGIVLALTLVVAGLTALGGTIGGSLVYDYGFNVETAGDSPVWHPSERDVLPADKGDGAAH
ncbi:MAG TPA: DUF2231 domain-containing protein [Egibacteraceae bacterium]|nr:DUF2231 domain-containing protein [Egibacteraceae bacterium]